ncbi:hypothetical protein [Burkholderia sp. WAC0059]|uniref:hypothetical protein n=1 Tax=Burkholderia sp. WAC0059 TaxID=2066022 RepID=UPI0011AFAD0D|nr:hypothetical protein [Burkholderia sp. WAC0059]
MKVERKQVGSPPSVPKPAGASAHQPAGNPYASSYTAALGLSRIVPGLPRARNRLRKREAANAPAASHPADAASLRKKHYREHLANQPDQAELMRIRIGHRNLAQIAKQTDSESRHALANAIAGHGSDGRSTAELDRMRDILVGRHIVDAQDTTRHLAGSVYRGALSALGLGAIAGSSGRNRPDDLDALVPRTQHYRDKKEAKILDTARNLMGRLGPADAAPEDWQRAFASAKQRVDGQPVSRLLPFVKFEKINENKSTSRKKEEIDLVSQRASELVTGAIRETGDQDGLRALYFRQTPNAPAGRQALTHFYRGAKALNPNLEPAFQLMRTLGMSNAEALAALRSAVGRHLAPMPDAHPEPDLASRIGSAMAQS